jgi:excisionase family DNA binding protein
MSNQNEECLTISVQEAAKILGISRGLAYQMIRERRIPALRFGRVIRIPWYALQRLLAVQGEDMEDNSAEA